MLTGRPREVRRWLRTPLWWSLVILVGALFIYVDQVRDITREDRAFTSGYRVVGRIDPDDDGGPVREATYRHPKGDQLHVHFSTSSLHLDPQPRDEVRLEVARDNPTKVRVAGDHREPDAWFLGLFALLTVPAWAMRRWSLRQAQRLAGSAQVAFQMTAVVTSPGWLGRRWRLHLYPLDAPGGPPVCTVPIVAPPSELGPRTVEVKGGVRPYGRVVARDQATGEVLWPTGRALRAHGFLRSSLEPARSAQVPAAAPWLIAFGLTLLGAGLAVLLLVTDTEDVQERAYLVPARVVTAEGAHAHVQVRWLGAPIDADVLLRRPHAPGEIVHLFLDPAEPARIWGGIEEPPGVLSDAVPGLMFIAGFGLWVTGVAVRRRGRRRSPPPRIAAPLPAAEPSALYPDGR
jgi:hypothetical protein